MTRNVANSLEYLSMLRELPQMLHDGVHRPPVIEFLFKLDTLSCHLDTHENFKKICHQLQ